MRWTSKPAAIDSQLPYADSFQATVGQFSSEGDDIRTCATWTSGDGDRRAAKLSAPDRFERRLDLRRCRVIGERRSRPQLRERHGESAAGAIDRDTVDLGRGTGGCEIRRLRHRND